MTPYEKFNLLVDQILGPLLDLSAEIANSHLEDLKVSEDDLPKEEPKDTPE